MIRVSLRSYVMPTLTIGLLLLPVCIGATKPEEPSKPVALHPSVDEARERARLLHGTIHDTLQIVHESYYREDEGLAIPAATLNRVFQGVAERNKVELRWLVVDGRAMNVDHNPRDEFEKEAATVLGSGKEEYERAADGVYRFAGVITLKSECLKCHLPNRMSNKNRAAGLVITMPIGKK